MNNTTKGLAIAAIIALCTTGGVITGMAARDTDSIPRCINDDFNDGSQDRCWTETGAGKVIVISKADEVIS